MAELHSMMLKLPPFCKAEATTWFRLAENLVRLRKISADTAKADHVLHALPKDLFREVVPWLDM